MEKRPRKMKGVKEILCIYVREHMTWVFIPQPKKLDLEITGLVSKNVSCHIATVQLKPLSAPCCTSWKRKGYK